MSSTHWVRVKPHSDVYCVINERFEPNVLPYQHREIDVMQRGNEEISNPYLVVAPT